MRDVAVRLLFTFVVLSAAAYCVLWGMGSMIYADVVANTRSVLVRDVVRSNVHQLSGMVMVHRTCSQLSVAIEKVADTQYRLRFSTWDVPAIPCALEDTPRAFRAIIFASGPEIQLSGSLDGEPLVLTVLRDAQSL